MEGVKHEYHEGPKAGENFEQLARAVLQPQRPKRRKMTLPSECVSLNGPGFEDI